ncbi:MAG: T9SS type A sorting domain-containing protein [Chlorobiota bacterium]|nr:MAG: T9SS type A sorting domain-containing protein [Chlorobiota bacterium]
MRTNLSIRTALFSVLFLSLLTLNLDVLTVKKKYFKKNENEKEKLDGSDLAILQEIELTKDPSLGIVPHDRLFKAIKYTNSLNKINSTSITWNNLGPKDVGGRTRCIMVDPNESTLNTVWIGSVGGGLWKTNNVTLANPTWLPVDELLANLAVTTITYNPNNSNEFYFGTGEGWYNSDAIRGDGIFKSSNGGVTFTQLSSTANNSNFRYIQKIICHPSLGIFAGTSTGVFRSTDNGSSWSSVLSGACSDLEVGSDNTIYASIGIFSTDGIYSSTTGVSGSWVKRNNSSNGFPTSGFYRIEIACAQNNANVLYALTQSASNNGIYNIYKTTNKCVTWTTCKKPTDSDPGIGSDFTRGQAWYDLALSVDPNNSSTLLIGGINLFKSTNSGANWSQLSHWYGGYGKQYVHADNHSIVFKPGNSSIIYFGNDGGIFSSTNGGSTISSKNSNYCVTQLFACATHPTSNLFLSGAQDNGSFKYNSLTLNTGNQVTGGDGAYCHIDQNQTQYQFTAYVYNNYYRSTNSGSTFSSVTLSGNTGASFINPTTYDNVSNVMYCSDVGRYCRWNNPQSGNSHTMITVSNFGSSAKITSLKVSPNVSNRVYFGLSNGRVIYVDNANSVSSSSGNYINNFSGVPTGSVSCIEVEPSNENHIIITYSNYGISSIWETKNGGSNWVNIENNLPDMPIRWALLNPLNNRQVFLATELGVWTTDSLFGNNTTWYPINLGLANVSTRMLSIRNDNLIIAATHGRGLYYSESLVSFNQNKKIKDSDVLDSIKAVKSKLITNQETGSSKLLVNVYPNPFNKNLKIKAFSNNEELINLSIYNLKGGLVYSCNITSLNENLIDLSFLSNGNYLAKFDSKNEHSTLKIVKE